jgi:hypothetical protein
MNTKLEREPVVEVAPLGSPVESEINIGAVPAGSNAQTSSRDVRCDGDPEDNGSNCSRPHEPVSPPTQPVKATIIKGSTKAELLGWAKETIDAGENSLRDAVEALALAQKDFNATQREIAEAVGRSASWVNRVLKWRRSGYRDYSPFGPTTKAGRVAHAQQRVKASKLRKPDATTTKMRADAKTSSSSVYTKTGKPSPAQAKGELIYAIRHWWPYTDNAGRIEVTAVFLKQKGVSVSGANDPSSTSGAIS